MIVISPSIIDFKIYGMRHPCLTRLIRMFKHMIAEEDLHVKGPDHHCSSRLLTQGPLE